MPLSTDIDQAKRFLNVFGSTQFTFQTFDDNQKRKSRSLVRVLHGTIEQHFIELSELSANGAGVFVTINETDLKGRTEKNIMRVRAVFADFDETDGRHEAALNYERKPHIVVESSPGKFHVYWLVSDMPLNYFSAVQRAIIARFGSDRVVKDLPRVMRLPGFFHQKHEPFKTRIVRISDHAAYNDMHLHFANIEQSELTENWPDTALMEPKKINRQLHGVYSKGQRQRYLLTQCYKLRIAGLQQSTVLASLLTLDQYHCQPPKQTEPGGYDRIAGIVESAFKKDLKDVKLTDKGFAELFIEKNRSDLFYEPDISWWYEWTGEKWQQTPTAIPTQKYIETVQLTVESWLIAEEQQLEIKYSELAIASDRDQPKIKSAIVAIKQAIKETKSAVNAIQSNSRIKSIIDYATRFPEIQDYLSQYDQVPTLLNLINGVLDLTTGQLLPRKHGDKFTKCANVEFDAKATAPRWNQFIEEITCGDTQLAAWLQVYSGYASSGLTDEHIFPIAIGNGENGKSIFTETLTHVLGDYAGIANSSTIMAQRHETAGGPREDVLSLRGLRFVNVGESTRGDQLNESMVKRLTGGDTIRARTLYQTKSIEFKPEFKFFMHTNHKMQVKGTDNGIWRRLRLIPFRFKVKNKEKNLAEILRAEASGILNWMIVGFQMYLSGGFPNCDMIDQGTETYREDEDRLSEFLFTRYTELDPPDVTVAGNLHLQYETSLSDLYTDYIMWCNNISHEKQMSKKAFSQALEERRATFTTQSTHKKRKVAACTHHPAQ
jgi:P4 family phage/plasmid primase-like protien